MKWVILCKLWIRFIADLSKDMEEYNGAFKLREMEQFYYLAWDHK